MLWLSRDAIKEDTVSIRVSVILPWTHIKGIVYGVKIGIGHWRLVDNVDVNRPHGVSAQSIADVVSVTI
jgi:hypothetical protein